MTAKAVLCVLSYSRSTKKGRFSADVLFFMMLFPFGDKLQLFLVGELLGCRVISSSCTTEKNEDLNSEEYEKKEKHGKTSFDFLIDTVMSVGEKSGFYTLYDRNWKRCSFIKLHKKYKICL